MLEMVVRITGVVWKCTMTIIKKRLISPTKPQMPTSDFEMCGWGRGWRILQRFFFVSQLPGEKSSNLSALKADRVIRAIERLVQHVLTVWSEFCHPGIICCSLKRKTKKKPKRPNKKKLTKDKFAHQAMTWLFQQQSSG